MVLKVPLTYDEAGFQLDYEKVAQLMKPQPYNKNKMVRGMERHISGAEREEEEIFNLFFRVVPNDQNMRMVVNNYVKDHVSKDLNLPWHQIDPGKVKLWRDKGFQPVEYTKWWKEPTAEEKKRFSKMLGGASLRKDF